MDPRYAETMDIGKPVSYLVLTQGTPVYSAQGDSVGSIAHVLSDEHEDVFDGLVVADESAPKHRFADADQVSEIGEHGVVLKLTRDAYLALPEPSANPAVMRDDPAETRSDLFEAKLRRAWNLLSGKS